ncbi:MAG TPA: Crp/Fnr family transcriptional regulator [Panacibacter sp.]|nr:Crp/Fnr family transcriptional regulator [Panacibacter sp.]HNP44309.1 Crp/Fnr family transcriptional regulator [Panacibacter sp.]
MKQVTPEISCVECNAKLHSIFHKMQLQELENLDGLKSCGHYKKGQYIFTERGNPLGLFCINRGKIKLTATGENGKEQILRLLKEGDVIGYRSLISNDRYHCSAVAIEDSSVCFIPRSAFNNLIKENSAVSYEVMKLLSDNLKKAERQIVSLAQKNVRERMAEALLFFKASYGINTEDKTLNVALSREEIADFVGTSTETAIRLLSEFNGDDLIKLHGKKIQITNVEGLIKTAGLEDH